MKKSEKLTQERLKELLHYDPETGIFIWKVNRSGRKKGNLIGNKNKRGQICINGKAYLMHRLAWLYVHGYFPENDIDHIDRNPANNKLNNLREVSHTCNLRNTGNQKNNTSGIKGVGWDKNYNKWQVRICLNKKQKLLGYYKSFDEAVCARLAGEQCLDWSGCDSSSPAYQYVQNMLNQPQKRKLPKIIIDKTNYINYI